MEKNNYIVAIDGGAGVGKTSISKELAKKLNVVYIDTGAMYRAVALYFIQNRIEISEENIQKYIDKITVDIAIDSGVNVINLNGINVTDKIRTEEVSMAASKVSKFKKVREKLVNEQRRLALNQSVVIEGRDTTTVVFPNATLKIYLTASIDVRAKRRYDDLIKENNSFNLSLKEVKQNMIIRDTQDTTRKESPLSIVKDAITVDTSDTNVDGAVEKIISLLKEKINKI